MSKPSEKVEEEPSNAALAPGAELERLFAEGVAAFLQKRAPQYNGRSGSRSTLRRGQST